MEQRQQGEETKWKKKKLEGNTWGEEIWPDEVDQILTLSSCPSKNRFQICWFINTLNCFGPKYISDLLLHRMYIHTKPNTTNTTYSVKGMNQIINPKTMILLFKGQHRREVLTVCHRSDAMLLKTLFKEAGGRRRYSTISRVSKLMESKTVVVWSGCKNDNHRTCDLRDVPVFINSSDVWFDFGLVSD